MVIGEKSALDTAGSLSLKIGEMAFTAILSEFSYR